MIEASILIPTYNRRDNLERLFESIRKQSFTAFEVIVSDGGSNDGTGELCQKYNQFFRTVFVLQDKTGFVNAVNCAINSAKGDIAIRIDDDVVLTEDWLKNLMAVFRENPDVGCATGPVITPGEAMINRDVFLFQDEFKKGNWFWRLIGKFYNDFLCEGQFMAIGKDFKSGAISFGANFPDSLKLDKIIEVDHPESCNMAFKRELSQRVGNFDECYTETSEYSDTDLAYRMRRLGYKTVFSPRAVLYHYPSKKGFYSMRLDPYHRVINFIRFYRRNIKADSLDKMIRFLAYLLFFNGYFFYNFLKMKDPKQLKSFPATVVGLTKPLKFL
ncbi:MAG: glycosyltransferase [Candidatus Omnitrophica bacterium]|nr:glycosyltransferase [Candidatus Omnitrophota bacterium]